VGAVFDSKDLARDRKEVILNALKDLSPDTRARTVKIFESWKGPSSERELAEILGMKRAKKIGELFGKSTKKPDLTEEQSLKELFKESVTFD
jgi:hypothetical protein